jgi:hypothetical protein
MFLGRWGRQWLPGEGKAGRGVPQALPETVDGVVGGGVRGAAGLSAGAEPPAVLVAVDVVGAWAGGVQRVPQGCADAAEGTRAHSCGPDRAECAVVAARWHPRGGRGGAR